MKNEEIILLVVATAIVTVIMILGRSNYERASKALGIDFVSNPQLLEQPRYATQVSCWWWADKGLNEIADTGDFRKVTRVVNGGITGGLKGANGMHLPRPS